MVLKLREAKVRLKIVLANGKLKFIPSKMAVCFGFLYICRLIALL